MSQTTSFNRSCLTSMITRATGLSFSGPFFRKHRSRGHKVYRIPHAFQAKKSVKYGFTGTAGRALSLSLSAQKSRRAEEIKKSPRNYTVNRPRREHRCPSPSRIPTNQSRRILQNYRVHHRRRYFNLPLRRYVPQIYRRAFLQRYARRSPWRSDALGGKQSAPEKAGKSAARREQKAARRGDFMGRRRIGHKSIRELTVKRRSKRSKRIGRVTSLPPSYPPTSSSPFSFSPPCSLLSAARESCRTNRYKRSS